MANFNQNTNVKSAVRRIANPIPDVDAFNNIVQSVITNNPFGCISYMSGGINHPPVEKSREAYTAKFVYEDTNAKRVGSGSESYNTLAGFKAGIPAMVSNAANTAAHGGSASHDAEADTFSATLRCHDPTGEIYFVSFSRQQVAISSYESDAIKETIETWADGVPSLA